MAYNATTFRGAGTEIIRSVFFKGLNNTSEKLIVGVQHHIYTVLSVTARCRTKAGTEQGYLRLKGYDSKAGTTAQDIDVAVVTAELKDTWVWNDKFSFNGYEPVDFAVTMDATKHDAIADQGSSVSQYLSFFTDTANTTFDLTCTYIDQNNS